MLAHEFGHHIRHQIGTLGYAQQDPQGPESGAVQLEELTEEQLAQAIDAAEVIGENRIQETVQGRVTPEAFTHGTSEQRRARFSAGYRTGDIAQCDTFDVQGLDTPPALTF